MSKKKEVTIRKEGNKIYADELVKAIIEAKKPVLKELAYR